MKTFVKRYAPFLISQYYFFQFIFRAFRLRFALVPLDRAAPFRGPAGASGLHFFRLSPEGLAILRVMAAEASNDAKIHFSSLHFPLLRDLFGNLKPVVREYLGDNCFLDGVNWLVTDAKAHSISSNWHTDNVGNRLRVFVCAEGDGSQPTHVVPSAERIPNTVTWLRNTAIEAMRWAGFNVKFRVSNSFSCNHNDGTVYIFDTQLLHRGGYESGARRRVILQIDFSNPQKHALARGPIGTDAFNSFSYDIALEELEDFRSMVDPLRVGNALGSMNQERRSYSHRRSGV